MKNCIAVIALALAARSETYTLTNGTHVSGTVVSSIVAQVVLKTPLGQLRQIPVAAFSKADRARLPEDAAGIYANYIKLHTLATELAAQSLIGSDAAEREIKREIEHGMETSDLHDEMMVMLDERDRLKVEIKAWRDANDLRESSAPERLMFVAQRIDEFRVSNKR